MLLTFFPSRTMGKMQGRPVGQAPLITWGVAYLGSEAKLWVVGMVFPGELESRVGSCQVAPGGWESWSLVETGLPGGTREAGPGHRPISSSPRGLETARHASAAPGIPGGTWGFVVTPGWAQGTREPAGTCSVADSPAAAPGRSLQFGLMVAALILGWEETVVLQLGQEPRRSGTKALVSPWLGSAETPAPTRVLLMEQTWGYPYPGPRQAVGGRRGRRACIPVHHRRARRGPGQGPCRALRRGSWVQQGTGVHG